jgi:arabinofuranan 3-O-arabinosyltransferase
VTGTVAAAVDRQPLAIEACGGPLVLGAGAHDLRTAVGRDLGVDVDRLLLTSDTTEAAAARPAPPIITVTGQTRVSYDLRVDDASQPFWLVLGQSHNDGWHAVADGHDLGAPALADGYANGWRVTPPPGGAPLTITLTWTPQRLVWIALLITVIATAACLVIVVVDRRRLPDRSIGVDAPAGRRRVPGVVAAAGAAVGFTIIGGPLAGAAAGLTGLAAVLGPHWLRRWLVVVPGAMMAVVAAYVVAKSVRYPIPPTLDWPSAFAATDAPAWAAVAVAITLVVIGGREPHPP